jgi:hypothetical protein
MLPLIAALTLIAAALCQYWADGYWPAEEGVKQRTLRSWGCRFDGTQDGHDRWSRDRTSCGGQAFRLARAGVTGDALIAAMDRRGRCVQDDSGGWIPKVRRR